MIERETKQSRYLFKDDGPKMLHLCAEISAYTMNMTIIITTSE